MKILFINPNTSELFTEKLKPIVQQYAASGTIVDVKKSTSGPNFIESLYDEILTSPGTLETLIQNLDEYDAFVIACFSDHPTIRAAREITDKPVIGVMEAAMYYSCMLGHKFSIVTTNKEWEPLLFDGVIHNGLAARCASVRSTGYPISKLVNVTPEKKYELIRDSAQLALDQDGAEVIILGCAGMGGVDKSLEVDLGVPVIDGVVAALKILEGVVGYGLKTSKRLAYSKPGPKDMPGYAPIFSKPYNS